jgi:hypothetical protein
MRRIEATNISSVFAQLAQLAQLASTGPKDENVPMAFLRGRISVFVLQTILLCAELNLPESLAASRRLELDAHGEAPVSNQELLWKLDSLRTLMESEMSREMYFRVEANLTRYLSTTNPQFGADVHRAFPSTKRDIAEAANCLAFGCDSATVLLLMRVAEIGLWELGRDRQIPLAQSGKIEFQEWGMIIREIETAVRAIQQWPNSRTKEEAHRFYNHALEEIRAFNDGWRRHAAHNRPAMLPPSPEDALAAWGHVERFMKMLASRIEEGKYTDLEWKP